VTPFILRREELVDRVFDRVRVFGTMKDINFKSNPEFSKLYYLKGDQREKIRSLFNDDLLDFFLENPIEHVECNGKELLVVGGVGITKTENIVPRIKSIAELVKIMDNRSQ